MGFTKLPIVEQVFTVLNKYSLRQDAVNDLISTSLRAPHLYYLLQCRSRGCWHTLTAAAPPALHSTVLTFVLLNLANTEVAPLTTAQCA
jgi:hypothetical protein